MTQIRIGGVVAIVGNAGVSPGFVAAMRRRPELAHDVPLDAAYRGVPARLVRGVPHIEVIVVDSHADEVFGPGFLIQRKQKNRVELIAFPDLPADVFIAELEGWP